MPFAKLLPAPSSVAAEAGNRDRAIDVARLSALVVVMFGHCALLLATIDSDGLWIGNILGELPQLTPITWVVQVMPLFFFAGGAAAAYGWHPGTAWGSWLVSRAQRLCRPVFWYLAFWTATLVVARLILGGESADRLGRECVALLWFLGVYLVVIAFVPLLTRIRSTGSAAAVVAALVAVAAGVDQIRFAVGSSEAGVGNFLFVWLIPVVIGVARRCPGPPAPWPWCWRRWSPSTVFPSVAIVTILAGAMVSVAGATGVGRLVTTWCPAPTAPRHSQRPAARRRRAWCRRSGPPRCRPRVRRRRRPALRCRASGLRPSRPHR